jgi:hypothetical protein
MRNKAKDQGDECDAKPQPPGALPKMVIHHRSQGAGNQPNSEPEPLALDKKVNVTVTVVGKGACAKKHHDTDDKQAEHGHE